MTANPFIVLSGWEITRWIAILGVFQGYFRKIQFFRLILPSRLNFCVQSVKEGIRNDLVVILMGLVTYFGEK